MVLYRKYRPQKLIELDQDTVRQHLTALVSSGQIPHAFLFVGPKGTGKTSAARIVAKIINCEKSKKENYQPQSTIEPCNLCDTCISITAGNNLDVLEIDAASNRGIDEIRALREKIRLSPVGARAKVYIIDEVHMLTTEAFNALLKILEEPPAHVYFILATTQGERLPETITSRSFIVEFAKATEDELIHALTRVINGERVRVEPGTLKLIADCSQGAFRDAVKLLEEALAYVTVGEKDERLLTFAKVAQLFGDSVADGQKFLSLLVRRDTLGILEFIEALADKGVSFRSFVEQVIAVLHRQLLSTYGLEKTNGKVVFGSLEITSLMEKLGRAAVDLRNTPIPQLPLELAVIEWIEGSQSPEARVQKPESRSQSPEEKEQLAATISGINPKSRDSEVMTMLIEEVKKNNQSIAGVLRGCKQLTIEDDTVIISTQYQFHYDKLNEGRVKELLAEMASEILGKAIKVKFVLNQFKS